VSPQSRKQPAWLYGTKRHLLWSNLLLALLWISMLGEKMVISLSLSLSLSPRIACFPLFKCRVMN
jgi:hypothetical protein